MITADEVETVLRHQAAQARFHELPLAATSAEQMLHAPACAKRKQQAGQVCAGQLFVF